MSIYAELAREYQELARSSLKEITAPFQDGHTRIVINPKYLAKHRTSAEAMKLSLDVNVWKIASLGTVQELVGMGTTQHKGLPVIAPKIGHRKEIGLFVKPQDLFGARTEYKNATIALDRGVPNPQMVGVIEKDDESLIISELLPSAEPLSLRRLDYMKQDPRIYSARAFLIDFLLPIADAHEKGVAFCDLHLGNLGYRYSGNHRPGKIFFDLETAMVLDDLDLSKKKKGTYSGQVKPTSWRQFEKYAIEDIATFFANLSEAKFAMDESELMQYGWQTYNALRVHPIAEHIPDEEALDILYQTYLKTIFSMQDHREKQDSLSEVKSTVQVEH